MMQIQTNDVEVPDFFVTVLADDGGVDFPSNSSSHFENKLCRDISIPDGLYECGLCFLQYKEPETETIQDVVAEPMEQSATARKFFPEEKTTAEYHEIKVALFEVFRPEQDDIRYLYALLNDQLPKNGFKVRIVQTLNQDLTKHTCINSMTKELEELWKFLHH
jgi:hypothetical protein